MMRFFRCLTILFILVSLGDHSGHAQQSFPDAPVLFEAPLSPRIANYRMEVNLNPQSRMLKGKQILQWRNTTRISATELQLHLYLNGFRNSESTFMQTIGMRHRPAGGQNSWGYIDIKRMLRLAEGPSGPPLPINAPASTQATDITETIRFIQPTLPQYSDDQSVISVQLATPLQPGETIWLYIDFEAVLPDPPIARTGAKAEFFMVGQWFPKIGVYTNNGWKCHQFHANSEFFADFGVYDVAMTVPSENLLGATGLEVSRIENGDGTATHYYHAEDVHDFAWTTSPEFREYRGKAQDVDIRVLIQPDHEDLAARHVEATKVAVQHFQDWYGDYPYPNFTVVDPRRGADESGGMEYPTLVTAGTRYGLPDGAHSLERVIIHEFGHNYFYHMLASNEAEESWLDEGINSYAETKILNSEFGPDGDVYDLMGLKVNNEHTQRAFYLFFPDSDPTLLKSWEYYSGTSYAVNSYAKPTVFLLTLENYLGQETMRRIIRAYVERWRFRHPTSKDFVDVASDVAGQDLSWFFDQAVYTNRVLDYQVSRIFSEPLPKKEGYDFNIGNTDNAIMEDSLETTGLYHNAVHLRRRGDFIFPVELQVAFSDGDTLTERWDGKALWKKFEYIRKARLVSAVIDPSSKILLDVNMTNNSKAVSPSAQGTTKLSARWLFWTQFLFDQPEFLNLITLLGR